MTTYSIEQIVEEIQALADSYDRYADRSSITFYRFRIEPPVPWDKHAIETAFGITIPPDLEALWNRASALQLFMFGHEPEKTGLLIKSPSELVSLRSIADSFPLGRYFRSDDLIVGVHRVLWDFYVVIRCNSKMPDFGFVFVTQEMDERHEWVYAAQSFGAFLRRYLDANGEEYWHTGMESHVIG